MTTIAKGTTKFRDRRKRSLKDIKTEKEFWCEYAKLVKKIQQMEKKK